MNFIVIYVADNCTTCDRVISSAKTISSTYPNVELKIKNYKETKKNLTIVPAIFLNQNLFCYGDFDKQKLIQVISRPN